jgi:hypothetical protein
MTDKLAHSFLLLTDSSKLAVCNTYLHVVVRPPKDGVMKQDLIYSAVDQSI